MSVHLPEAKISKVPEMIKELIQNCATKRIVLQSKEIVNRFFLHLDKVPASYQRNLVTAKCLLQ